MGCFHCPNGVTPYALIEGITYIELKMISVLKSLCYGITVSPMNIKIGTDLEASGYNSR